MKLKKLMLLILCHSLLILDICAQKSQISSENSTQMLIEPSEMYSGQTVLKIIDVIKNEAEKAIENSFAEGYKQGLLESAPDTEFYKTQNDLLQKENKELSDKTKMNKYLYPLIFFGGAAAGCLIYTVVQMAG